MGGGLFAGGTGWTHVSADDLPCVHLLDFWLELPKIPNQGSHALRQRMHAVDEMTEGNETCKHKDRVLVKNPLHPTMCGNRHRGKRTLFNLAVTSSLSERFYRRITTN